MKKRIIASLMTLIMMMTMLIGVSAPAFAESEAKGSLKWSYEFEAKGWNYVGSPVVDEDYIYIVHYDELFKIKKDDGTLVKKIGLEPVMQNNFFSPTINDDEMYIPLKGGKLAVVSLNDMTVEYITYAENQSSHQGLTPAVYDEVENAVYLGTWKNSSGGTYSRVDLDDNSVKKIVDSNKGFYWAGACVEGDYVVFGSNAKSTGTTNDGNAILYAYNKSSGRVEEAELQDSGAICSTVIKHGGKYYFTSKGGYLYEAEISGDGSIVAAVKTKLSGSSICTPHIYDGKAYVGYTKGVDVIDLATGKIENTYSVPGSVNSLVKVGDKVYALYNNKTGGVYDILEGKEFFTPEEKMQQYNSNFIVADTDGTIFYANNSNYLMAVVGAVAENSDSPGTSVEGEITTAKDAKLYVTISSEGNIVMAREEVIVKDINNDGKLDIDETLYAAHVAKYPNGAAGYSSASSPWGLSLKMLWGIDNGGSYGYYVNNERVSTDLTSEVKKGDVVSAFSYSDLTTWSDLFSYFDPDNAKLVEGDSIKLTLYAYEYDDNWNLIANKVEGANISVDGDLTELETDKDGIVELTFDKKGEYIISAESDTKTLVPPVCKIVVGPVSIDTEGAAGEQETLDTAIDSGDDFNAIPALIIAFIAIMTALTVATSRRKN